MPEVARLAAVAACCVALMAGAGAASAAPVPAADSAGWKTMQRRQSPPSVWTTAKTVGTWLYGDSITVGHYAPLSAAAGAGRLAVDANSGIPTAAAVDRLAARVAAHGPPRQLIMAVGSNDAIKGAASGRVLAAQAARARRIAGPTTRIIWVTVWVRRVKQPAATTARDVAGTAAVNAALAAARKAGTVDAVVDWAAFLDRRRSLPGYYLRDGVHPNARGGEAWRAQLRPHLTPTRQDSA